MLVVGITGCLGSGKSTVTDFLAKRGAVVLRADEVGHELLEKGTPTFQRIVERFGKEILDEEGRIVRERLGDMVFKNKKALENLNEIVHPPLLERLRNRIREWREAGPGIAVLEAALIPEWGLEEELDLLVSVEAPKRKRQWWWTKKTDASEAAFKARDAGQLPAEEKAKNAQLVVRNHGDVIHLRDKAMSLWTIIAEVAETGTLPSTKTYL